MPPGALGVSPAPCFLATHVTWSGLLHCHTLLAPDELKGLSSSHVKVAAAAPSHRIAQLLGPCPISTDGKKELGY